MRVSRVLSVVVVSAFRRRSARREARDNGGSTNVWALGRVLDKGGMLDGAEGADHATIRHSSATADVGHADLHRNSLSPPFPPRVSYAAVQKLFRTTLQIRRRMYIQPDPGDQGGLRKFIERYREKLVRIRLSER